MQTKKFIRNGVYMDVENGMHHYCNAHLSYKGRSVIIDYEWILHAYDSTDVDKKKAANLVPFEVYPYATDIYVGYTKLDAKSEKVDLVDLISKLDKAIEKEFES